MIVAQLQGERSSGGFRGSVKERLSPTADAYFLILPLLFILCNQTVLNQWQLEALPFAYAKKLKNVATRWLQLGTSMREACVLEFVVLEQLVEGLLTGTADWVRSHWPVSLEATITLAKDHLVVHPGRLFEAPDSSQPADRTNVSRFFQAVWDPSHFPYGPSVVSTHCICCHLSGSWHP